MSCSVSISSKLVDRDECQPSRIGHLLSDCQSYWSDILHRCKQTTLAIAELSNFSTSAVQ